jgi:hypothetical protein
MLSMILLARDKILQRLRPTIAEFLSSIEAATNVEVRFQSLGRTSHVVATYTFDPYVGAATVQLGSSWEDVDVAHELVHMQLELVEGYNVLAWKRGVHKARPVELAFGRVRSYVDDEVVHARLAALGLQVDGEGIKSQFFEDICTNVPKYLQQGRSRANDGMAHLDSIGYGDLCRSCFLLQAELIRAAYVAKLAPGRLAKLEEFIKAFRQHRASEARRTDAILTFFKANDVQLINGHKEILSRWAEYEHLNEFVGVSGYQMQDGKHLLPWP